MAGALNGSDRADQSVGKRVKWNMARRYAARKYHELSADCEVQVDRCVTVKTARIFKINRPFRSNSRPANCGDNAQ
jgi:hypothetical protein